MRKLLAVALVVFLVGALGAVLCIPVDAQERVTDPFWTCVFEFKPSNDTPMPLTRIYVFVSGKTEGQAAINAHKSLCEMLTTHAQGRLVFVESQVKK